jgi:phage repressor protein C with HTH and peptisase S24 domain
VRIPVYKDIKASCGAGIENFLEDVSEYLDIDPYILKIMGIQTKPENLRIIYSSEYSMWPTVAPDSPLFVDISDKDPDMLKNGNVYVFTHSNELRMKRIFVSYAGGKTVRLASDNPDKVRYPDEFITNEQLNEINFVGRLELALVKP